MFDDKKIDVLRVEVLDNNVQKYSSTTVTGGGGYVSSVNGTTMGRTESISSTVDHHVSQDMWLKDLASGHEMQLSLKDVQIPVRPGHRLWIAYDHGSERWERIINETTGDFTYGNGSTNPIYVAEFRKGARQSIILPILLIIPFLNFLGGFITLVTLFSQASNTVSKKTIPGNIDKVLKALVLGIALFLATMWAFVAIVGEPERNGFFTKVISFAAAIVLTPMFARAVKAPYIAAAEMIDDRSRKIDAALEQAKAKSSAKPVA